MFVCLSVFYFNAPRVLRVLYLHACPKLLGSDPDPGGEHCGPSASPGIFRAHLAHVDVIRSETVAAAALF